VGSNPTTRAKQNNYETERSITNLG
jgi:hypothetical protein